MSAGPGCLGEQAGEAEHPPVDGDVVDLGTAFGEQFLDIAVRQTEARLPADASTITSDGKQKPANAERAMGLGRGLVLMATVCLLEGSVTAAATAPLRTPSTIRA